MKHKNKKIINILCIIFSISIVFFINFFILNWTINENKDTENNTIFIINETLNQKENTNFFQEKQNITIDSESIKKVVNNTEDWKIEIPSIYLNAKIQEGTTQSVMRKSVAHFSETSSWNGNVGLAAHNRGDSSFFKNIKKLKNGDKIIYTNKKQIREYKVEISKIIDETDWSYLQPTKDNRITLITCVEGKPKYRRCVQAVEI